MNTFKFWMLCNVLIKGIYAICVTVAAISFDKPAILWWYLLLLLVGYELSSEHKNKEER